MGKKLKVGWFSFSCCEDSSIVFTELLNERYEQWFKLLDFKCARILKKNKDYRGMDVAFVEGAIANPRDKAELLKIRKNAKKLVAIGSCAVTGGPSAQRNKFSPALQGEIESSVKKFKLGKKVKKLSDIVQVDDEVPGCPMVENLFLKAVDKYLKEFGVIA